MKQKLYIVLLFLLNLPPFVSAQNNRFSIAGQVRGEYIRTTPPYDVLTTPLIHAYIQIKELPRQGWLTDTSGYFKIDSLLSKEYHLTFSFVGLGKYDTIIILDQKSHFLPIRLPLCYEYIKKYHYSPQLAQETIQAGVPTLVIFTSQKEEKQVFQHPFWKKYGVSYICYTQELIEQNKQILGAPGNILAQYNQETFHYLDREFGPDWRSKAPKNIFGLDTALQKKYIRENIFPDSPLK